VSKGFSLKPVFANRLVRRKFCHQFDGVSNPRHLVSEALAVRPMKTAAIRCSQK
jgi:hypothetical protein